MTRLLSILLVITSVAAAQSPGQAPANDNLAAAELLLDVPLEGDTTGSTDEPDEGVASCGAGQDEPGVWYVLPEAEEEGIAVVDTRGSGDFDTVLSIWIGAGHPLTQIACSDDVVGDLWSRVAIDVLPAATYYVKVSGEGGKEGPFVINSTVAIPPPNDYLANAIPINDPTSFRDTQNTIGATHELDETFSACGLYQSGDEEASVWYKLTSTEDQAVRLTTEGSNFDTVLSVWVGGPAHPLTEFSCGDDTGFYLWSSLEFTAQAGVPYFIKAAGGPRETGQLVIGTPRWPVFLPFANTP